MCFNDSFPECKTAAGPTPNVPCIFPFKYKGKTYHECTTIDSNNIPWCPTMVDASGNGVGTNWGICGSECIGLGNTVFLSLV